MLSYSDWVLIGTSIFLGIVALFVPYLAELVKNTPSASNIVAYAEAVRERALIREMIAAANDIADAGFNPEGRESTELLDFAETIIYKIAEKRDNDGR